MKTTNRTVTTLAAMLYTLLAGCGAQPTLESDSTTPVAPAQATTVAAAAEASVTTVTGAASVDGQAAPEAKKTKVPNGYRLKKRKGRELYCRSEGTVGTRFTEQMCYTREQLDALAEHNDRMMDDFERGRSTCTNPSFCGGQT